MEHTIDQGQSNKVNYKWVTIQKSREHSEV